MFHFLIGLFIVGLVIMAMISSPAFRNVVILIVILIVGGVWWAIDSSNKTSEKNKLQQAAAEQLAISAIKLSDIKIDDVKLKKASYGLTDYVLDGLVTNMSVYQLGTIYFEITMTDCQNNDCRIVGQQSTSASVNVPAGQLRAFSSYAVKFLNLPPLNGANRSWEYKISRLRTG
jgi:type II secretory pathway pseudopilin PulG